MGHRGLPHDLKMIMRGHILEVDHGDAYNNAVATCTERTIISHRDIFAARVEGTLAQPGVASELGWKAQAACNMDQSCPVRLKGKAIGNFRSEEHTSELQSLMRISYAVFCLKKTKKKHNHN